MQFQPKIIIGSVVGFIASVIGIIAIFFPSLFNLEQKKIETYSATLNTVDDYKNFLSFILANQDKVVHLNLTYFEKGRWRWEKDENGETKMIDFNYIREELSDETPEFKEGEVGYADIDSDGYIFVTSAFKKLPYVANFFRSKGGFGIWIKGKDDWGADDKTYAIIISGDSQGNNIYKWNMKDRNKNIEEMILQGTFYVNKMVRNYDYNKDVAYSMSPQFYELRDLGGDLPLPVDIIDLEPLSKKDLESSKYK